MATEQVIAVMGVTGAGKSAFIKLVTGDERIQVGKSLVSETSVVSTYKFRHKDRTIVLVDTPGFDDTHKKDADVLKLLANWFEATYRSGTKLSGIIYLHRITDDRMRGSSMRSMRMFRQLCGESFYRNLLLGTTCWSLIPEEVGKQRETELMTDENFWKNLIGKGAQFVRIPDDGFTAKEIIYDLACLEPMALQIQRETVDLNLQFGSLSATQTLGNDLGTLEAEHEAEKRRMELEHQRKIDEQIQKENALRDELEEERRKQLLKFRLDIEHALIKESTTKFNDGIKNDTYIAKLHVLSDAFATSCDGCCRWVGNDPYYVCSNCIEGKFVLCGACWRRGTTFCYDKSHHAGMMEITSGDGTPGCRLTKWPVVPDVQFNCYRCKTNLEGIFVHCCACLDDRFNMCLGCLTMLGTCKKSWSLSGHRLYPMIRRTMYQPTITTPGDSGISDVLFKQACEHKDQENWSDAERKYLLVLKEREPNHGPEDQLIRDSKYNLGLIYDELERPDEAVEMLKAAMEGEEKAFGPGDSRTMFTAFKLGRAYMSQKNVKEAESMYLCSIEREKGLGTGDEVVRSARFNLGLIYEGSGQREKAIGMFELALKGNMEALGAEHKTTLSTVAQLAELYRDLSQYEKAERTSLQLLAGREKTLGPDDKLLLDTFYNTGILYKRMEKYDTAEIYFRRALVGYERTLGPDHSETLDGIDKVAEVLVLDRKFQPAAELYSTVMQLREQKLGLEHEDTKKSVQNLGDVFQKMEDADSTNQPASHLPQGSPPEYTWQTDENYIDDLVSALPRLKTIRTHPLPKQWDLHDIQLVLAGEFMLETHDSQGLTPLLWAIRENNQNSATQLLGKGADFESTDPSGGSAVHLSVQSGNASLTKILLEKGANFSKKDNFGQTPLHKAVSSGNEECVRLLLGSGVDINIKNNEGQTALQLAAAHKQTAIMTLLILGVA